MKTTQKIFLSIFVSLLACSQANAYQAQELKTAKLKRAGLEKKSQDFIAGRTYNHRAGSRVLPPKSKSYPFLDQLEYLLFPNLDFKKEKPGKRLERLELSVFGNKQKGKISVRLTNLQNEIDAWQIANMPVSDDLNKPKDLEDSGNAYAYSSMKDQGRASSKLFPSNFYRQRRVRGQRPRRANFNSPYVGLSPQARYSRPNSYQRSNSGFNSDRMLRPLINKLGNKTINNLFQ